jgi:hypothetical protein
MYVCMYVCMYVWVSAHILGYQKVKKKWQSAVMTMGRSKPAGAITP